MTTTLPLIKNILTILAKNALVPGLPEVASATDAVVQKKINGSAITLVFPNKDLNNIMKIVTSLEVAVFIIKDVTKTVENEVKEQKGRFLGMSAATLGASLLGNMLAGKGVVRSGDEVISASEEIDRAG